MYSPPNGRRFRVSWHFGHQNTPCRQNVGNWRAATVHVRKHLEQIQFVSSSRCDSLAIAWSKDQASHHTALFESVVSSSNSGTATPPSARISSRAATSCGALTGPVGGGITICERHCATGPSLSTGRDGIGCQ